MPEGEPATTDDGTYVSALPGVPPQGSRVRPTSLLLRVGVPVGLVILILLAFMPALDAGFVHWDDDDLLLLNTRYRELSGESLHWMFSTSYAGHFQPLTWLSYTLDYALWDGSPFGYHLTNVLLHVLTALAFYLVVRRLLAVAPGESGIARSAPYVLSAGLAAALFAVHPLRAESVAWIAERRDVLGGFLYVAAVGCYLRYVGEPPGAPAARRRLFYGAAVGLAVLSLLSKATAMTLPFVLLVLDVYPLRRLAPQRAYGAVSQRLVWLEKLPFLALAVWTAARALHAQAEGGALYGLAQHDTAARLGQACFGLAFYIWKTIWPSGLGPLYEIPPREVLLGPMFWGSLAAIAVLGGVAVKARRRWPAIPAALAVYVVILAPVLGLAQAGPQLVADRYSYLPCMGFAVLGAAWLVRALRRGSWWDFPHRRPALGLLAAIVIVALEHATYEQADVWLSPLKLWKRGVQVSPTSPVAHINYADALFANAAPGDAAWHYEKGLELNPHDPVGLHHFADLLYQFGDTEGAIRHYLRSLQVDPNRPRACLSLARLFVDTGQPRLALRVLRDGAERNPDAIGLIDYLARVLASHPDDTVRNGEEAVAWAKHVRDARGATDVPALTTLATALAEAGRFDEAVATAERALLLAEEKTADLHANRLRKRLRMFRDDQPYHLGP